MNMQQVFLLGFICLFSYFTLSLAFQEYEKRGGLGEKRGKLLLDDNDDSSQDFYDNEYPTIVPRKRTAIFLDKVMIALQKAIEEEEKATASASVLPIHRTRNLGAKALRSMDLQRRGHQDNLTANQKGRTYWRCYFNAVTCFK